MERWANDIEWEECSVSSAMCPAPCTLCPESFNFRKRLCVLQECSVPCTLCPAPCVLCPEFERERLGIFNFRERLCVLQKRWSRKAQSAENINLLPGTHQPDYYWAKNWISYPKIEPKMKLPLGN